MIHLRVSIMIQFVFEYLFNQDHNLRMTTHHTDGKKPARGGHLDMDITGDELLFEVRGPCGKVWRLYLDGRIEGFPDGVTIQNYAFPLWAALAGKVNCKRAIGIGAEQADSISV